MPPFVYPTRGSFGYLKWVAEHLEDFQLAVEFRNGRWLDEEHMDETLNFLERHRLAYVCVDEPQGFKSSVPPVVAVTAPVAEVRFHGRNAENWEKKGITAAERFRYEYPKEEMEEWVPRVKTLAEQADSVHALMNNCYADYGIRSADLLADLLGSDQPRPIASSRSAAASVTGVTESRLPLRRVTSSSVEKDRSEQCPGGGSRGTSPGT